MKKLTISELKDYIISESNKLYAVEVLKEEKKLIEKELSLLNESAPNEYNMDYETLKKVRQEMLKKAAGWDFSQSTQLDENKYSDKASNFIGKEISHLEKDKGYEHDRAVAASINIAKDKGYKVPAQKNEASQVFAGTDVTDPNVKMYFFKIKHDNGTDKLKIADYSQENAKITIAKYMNAPESAVEFVKEEPIK